MIRFSSSLAGLVLAGFSTLNVQAGELALSIPLDDGASVSSSQYKCEDGQELTIRTINSDENSLMLMDVDESEIVFVNVISASGARYVAKQYEWWGKGDEASFTNLMDEKSRTTCKIVKE